MNPLRLTSQGNPYSAYYSQIFGKKKLAHLKEEIGASPTGIRRHFDGKNIILVESIFGEDRVHVIPAVFDEQDKKKKKKVGLIRPTSCEHIHVNQGMVDIHQEHIDPDSTEHYHDVDSPDEWGCCDAEYGADTFEFDDANTPTTIVSDNHITVYVLEGCPPYTWEVSGTGYTWNSNGTDTLESSNTGEQLDCDAGT